MKNAWIIFLLIMGNTARADVRDYCAQVIEAKKNTASISKRSIIKDILRLRFFPGKLVTLKTLEVDVPDDLRVLPSDQSQSATGGRNVIFSIDPPEDILKTLDLDQMRQRNRELTAQIMALNSQLMIIAQSESVDECVKASEENNFDFDEYLRLIKERSSLQIVGQVDEGGLADRVIARTLPSLYLNWEVVHSTDLMAAHRALQDTSLENVVLVSHGISGGKLVDARMSEYPRGFFSGISPSIRSITIFACHAAEIVDHYEVQKALGYADSEFGSRFVYISIGTKIAGMEESVPVKAFRSFMKKVDGMISFQKYQSQFEAPIGRPKAPVRNCEMKFNSLAVTKGTFAFLLNGIFIGSANRGDRSPGFQYPCALANRQRNIVIIRNLSLNENADLESTAFKVEPMENGKTIKEENLIHYWRADQSYQGSKYEFSFES